MDDIIERAFELLEQIIRNGDGFAEDVDHALKFYTLDKVINKTLYTRPAEADPAA